MHTDQVVVSLIFYLLIIFLKHTITVLQVCYDAKVTQRPKQAGHYKCKYRMQIYNADLYRYLLLLLLLLLQGLFPGFFSV